MTKINFIQANLYIFTGDLEFRLMLLDVQMAIKKKVFIGTLLGAEYWEKKLYLHLFFFSFEVGFPWGKM
jgi:hypothetical protein